MRNRAVDSERRYAPGHYYPFWRHIPDWAFWDEPDLPSLAIRAAAEGFVFVSSATASPHLPEPLGPLPKTYRRLYFREPPEWHERPSLEQAVLRLRSMPTHGPHEDQRASTLWRDRVQEGRWESPAVGAMASAMASFLVEHFWPLEGGPFTCSYQDIQRRFAAWDGQVSLPDLERAMHELEAAGFLMRLKDSSQVYPALPVETG